jgi:hypothetical protein
MQKWVPFFYVSVFFVILGPSFLKAEESKSAESCVNPMTFLYVDVQGGVTQPIVNLLKVTAFDLTSSKLENVVAATQGKLNPSFSWIGSPTKERWEKDSQKITLSLVQAKEVINICSKELKQEEVVPVQVANPQGILFLGSTLSSVRKRLAHLNTLYNQGMLSTTTPVYLLTGERILDENVGETSFELQNPNNGLISFREDWQDSGKTISDEGEMIELVFAQSRHQKLNTENIYLVYSPKGTERRATTASTVKQWVQDFSPPGGSYVAISNAPYIFYQECVIRKVLLQLGRNDICVKVTGPSMEVKLEDESQVIKKAQNFLNNTARILKELLEIQQGTLSEQSQ